MGVWFWREWGRIVFFFVGRSFFGRVSVRILILIRFFLFDDDYRKIEVNLLDRVFYERGERDCFLSS